MDAGWWAKLEGEDGYLRDLAMHFNEGDLTVIVEGDAFYLGSTDLNGLTNTDDVRARAAELLAVACGAAELELGHFRPPRVAAAVRVDESGAKQHFIHVSSELRLHADISARVERTREDGSVEVVDVSPPGPRADEWARLARSNPDIEDALAILGRGELRWHDLYHVFEIVEAAVGETMFSAGWVTKAAIERFTRTANSRRAIGREARHGHDRFAAPKRPLPLAEARSLIVALVRSWLESISPPAEQRERVIEVRPPGDRAVSISDSLQ